MTLRVAGPAAVLSLLWMSACPAAADEAWQPGPEMSIGRSAFALVPLPSGDLLAPGGAAAGTIATNRVDLFSLASHTFAETQPMPAAHRYHPLAVLLGNGKLLIAGEQYGGSHRESLLFTEATHTWSPSAHAPRVDRFAGAMVLLRSRQVLSCGGYAGGDGPTYTSAELYDPVAAIWSATGAMIAPRVGHTLTLLTTGRNAGKVLVAGGGQWTGFAADERCELYDPATGTFSLTGSLHDGRAFHTATRLLDGRVLVTGGHVRGHNLATAEIYDPETGTWSSAPPLYVPRARHTATLMPDGMVIVVGGAQVGSMENVTASAESYRPGAGTWRTLPSMSTPRVEHAAALLPDGRLLIAGGSDGRRYLRSSELLASLSSPPAAAGNDVGASSPPAAAGNGRGASREPAAVPIPTPSRTRDSWLSPLTLSLGALSLGVLVAAAALALRGDD